MDPCLRATIGLVCVWLTGPGIATAQSSYESGFDGLLGSAAGVPLMGRDGFVVPATSPPSHDAAVFTYPGNALGVPPHPFGGPCFLGLSATAAGPAQVEKALAFPVECEMHIEFDICVIWAGSAAPTGDIGGFSLQPAATAMSANLLARWPAGSTFPPTTWDADLVVGPSVAGVAIQHPDSRWRGLPVGVWNRWGCSVHLAHGEYTLFAIENGATGVRSLYVPSPGSLLVANPLGAIPSTFRLAAVGNGCVIAMDRLSVAVHAGYHPFGTGCPGASGIPGLSGQFGSRPALSTSFTARLDNLANNLGIFSTGFSNTHAGAIPLPLGLGFAGMPGCALLVDPAVTMLTVGSGGTAQWNVVVPGGPEYMGLIFYQQGFSLDPLANSAGIAASNAARGCVGR